MGLLIRGHLIQQGEQVEQAPTTVPGAWAVLPGASAVTVSRGLFSGLQAWRCAPLEKMICCQGLAQTLKGGLMAHGQSGY